MKYLAFITFVTCITVISVCANSLDTKDNSSEKSQETSMVLLSNDHQANQKAIKTLVPTGMILADAKQTMLNQGFDWDLKVRELKNLNGEDIKLHYAICTRLENDTKWTAIIMFTIEDTVSTIDISPAQIINNDTN